MIGSLLGDVEWSDWANWSQRRRNVGFRSPQYSGMSVAAESSEAYSPYLLFQQYPHICSVSGVHTDHEHFFYTRQGEHPSHVNAARSGYFTMILTEAMEQSRNICTGGKSCKTQHTSMNR